MQWENRLCEFGAHHLKDTLQRQTTKHADWAHNTGNKGCTVSKCKRVTWYFDLLNIDSLNSRMTDIERAVHLKLIAAQKIVKHTRKIMQKRLIKVETQTLR